MYCLDAHDVGEGRSKRVKEETEAHDQQTRPQEEKKQERERAIDAINLFPHATVTGVLGPGGPCPPSCRKEEICDAEPSRGPAGQDDGLEGIEGDSQAAGDSGNECK